MAIRLYIKVVKSLFIFVLSFWHYWDLLLLTDFNFNEWLFMNFIYYVFMGLFIAIINAFNIVFSYLAWDVFNII